MNKCLIIVLYVLVKSSFAGEFSSTYSSKHESLKDHTVVYAGNLSVRNKNIYGSANRSVDKKREIFQLGFYCYNGSDFSKNIGYGQEAALLLVNKYGQQRVAIFEIDNGAIKVSVEDVRVFDCKDADRDDMKRNLDYVDEMRGKMARDKKEMEDAIRELERVKKAR